jgi:hypothetical protein
LKRVAIGIPIYSSFEKLADFELCSLKRAASILNKYDVYFIQSKKINSEPYIDLFKKNGVSAFKLIFDASYFISVNSYNKLLLSKYFYKKFKNYQFLLIYQTDAYVFYDALEEWCKLEYAFIGAPVPIRDEFKKNVLYPPLNGGFSLRNVSAHLKVLNSFSYIVSPFKLLNSFRQLEGKSLIKGFVSLFLNLTLRNNSFWLFNNFKKNEDGFWSMTAPQNFKWFKVPTHKDASFFSIEHNPEFFLKENNQQLPMGIHKWQIYYESFWKKFM